MIVSDAVVPTYNIITVINANTVAMGISRFGLWASSTAHERIWKPLNAQKQTAAPLSTPEKPCGKNPDVQLLISAYVKPTTITKHKMETFSKAKNELNQDEHLAPRATTSVIINITPMATRSGYWATGGPIVHSLKCVLVMFEIVPLNNESK